MVCACFIFIISGVIFIGACAMAIDAVDAMPRVTAQASADLRSCEWFMECLRGREPAWFPYLMEAPMAQKDSRNATIMADRPKRTPGSLPGLRVHKLTSQRSPIRRDRWLCVIAARGRMNCWGAGPLDGDCDDSRSGSARSRDRWPSLRRCRWR